MPENSSYMVAAYVVAAVIYLGYATRLLIRATAALREPTEPQRSG